MFKNLSDRQLVNFLNITSAVILVAAVAVHTLPSSLFLLMSPLYLFPAQLISVGTPIYAITTVLFLGVLRSPQLGLFLFIAGTLWLSSVQALYGNVFFFLSPLLVMTFYQTLAASELDDRKCKSAGTQHP
jgi:hypothetical protein